MSDIVVASWKKYILQLQSHPLRTKAITSGVLIAISNVIAQKISGAKRIQFKRLLLLMLYGLVYSGPFGHFYQKWMEAIFKGKQGKETVAKKVLLEQVTASPLNNMMFMIYYGFVVEGATWGSVKSKIRKDYPSVQLTALKSRPFIAWINYQFVPIQFRVLFQSFAGSCWVIFLNLRANTAAIKKA